MNSLFIMKLDKRDSLNRIFMLNQNRKISMKKYLLLSLVSMFSLFISAQTTTWKNDPAHSRLGFVVKHLTISEMKVTSPISMQKLLHQRPITRI